MEFPAINPAELPALDGAGSSSRRPAHGAPKRQEVHFSLASSRIIPANQLAARRMGGKAGFLLHNRRINIS